MPCRDPSDAEAWHIAALSLKHVSLRRRQATSHGLALSRLGSRAQNLGWTLQYLRPPVNKNDPLVSMHGHSLRQCFGPYARELIFHCLTLLLSWAIHAWEPGTILLSCRGRHGLELVLRCLGLGPPLIKKDPPGDPALHVDGGYWSSSV